MSESLPEIGSTVYQAYLTKSGVTFEEGRVEKRNRFYLTVRLASKSVQFIPIADPGASPWQSSKSRAALWAASKLDQEVRYLEDVIKKKREAHAIFIAATVT